MVRGGRLEAVLVEVGVFDVVGDEPVVAEDPERAEVGDQGVDPGVGGQAGGTARRHARRLGLA